jgi:DNA-binding GntR family transcriptional regulator
MPPPQPERSNPERSNADDAYQAIWRLLVTVAIPPGGAFTEGELVERLGIGKTPVREALLRLKAENRITGQPRAGYWAAPVTLKDVRDTCRAVGYLEAKASRHACDVDTRTVLDPLQAKVEEAAVSDAAGKTTDGWIRADWRFHLTLARCDENWVQADMMARLGDSILRFGYLALALGASSRRLAHHHDDLLDALAKTDHEAAVAATADIWAAAESNLVGTLSTADSIALSNVAITREKNAFYLDAAPPGPAVPDAFRSGLRPDTTAQVRRTEAGALKPTH